MIEILSIILWFGIGILAYIIFLRGLNYEFEGMDILFGFVFALFGVMSLIGLLIFGLFKIEDDF